MKIVFHAPDSALPSDFTADERTDFRRWALARMQRILIGSEVEVSSEPLMDPACLLVAVEGGSPSFCATVNEYCFKLLSRYRSTNKASGAEMWVGGFFKWVPL